ncbi:protein of unknown function [Methylocaldum szegediense]|uniref:Uncharacterized protein n=1 Tax=Methylocaldum szegediense TaxID=73780 RepID=A0ABM9I1X7_9GAMM|nr:protein of unknown function [Methylocaldum szegediense]
MAPKPSHGGRLRGISAEGEFYLQALLREEVELTLEELGGRYANTYGVTISIDALLNTFQCLYLEETGARLNMILPYGRAPRGERVIDERPVSPGETVSTVAVLTE